MSLRDLTEKTTPGVPWKPTLDPKSLVDVRNSPPRLDLYFVEDDARLIALAPDMAVLLADVFEKYDARMPLDLIARFRDLESRA